MLERMMDCHWLIHFDIVVTCCYYEISKDVIMHSLLAHSAYCITDLLGHDATNIAYFSHFDLIKLTSTERNMLMNTTIKSESCILIIIDS